jgi:sugar lactone lactonase YvrE
MSISVRLTRGANALARRIPIGSLTALTTFTALAACSSGENATADSAAKAADTTAAAAAAPAMFASAGATTDSMKTPESVRYDADLDAYFVSNINGNPSQKDGNGFIARVDAGNTSAMTMLAQGGKSGVTLNAPKGIAIVGDTLWVADIDVVRAFNKRTGAAIATVDLRPMKATFLNDVVAGPDGAIYVTDTGIRFDEKGGMSHPGQDQIFKIAGRKATVAVKGDSALKSPNGIAWDGANGRFVLGPFNDAVVTAWKDGDSTVTPVGTGPGGYDGVEVLSDGRVLVTSWNDSSVQVISNGTFRKVVGNVEGPADIGVDTKRNVVALPRFNAGRIEYFTISR